MSATPASRDADRGNLYTAFGLAAVGMLAYLDWITHRQIVVAIGLALVAGGAIVFRREIVARFNLEPQLAQVPASVRPVLAAVPAILYFLIRGQGTSGAGLVVLVSMGLVVGIVALFGRAIDERLAGFYRARNRVLPLVVRMILALILPILVAFLVIHGSLADLPALWGGTTNSPASPTGREGLFLLGSLLSAAIAFLLIREAPARANEGMTKGAAAGGALPAAQPASAAPWLPTHLVPPEGMQAWGAPDPSGPTTANLDGGLPVRILETAGDWARVEASNGWTGWIDGRRLGGGSG